MSEELKPCPFCGGKAEMNYERIPGEDKGFWAQIICCNCHGRSGGTWAGSYNAAERKEVKAWNRRVSDETAQLMTATNDELVKRFIAKEKAMNLSIEIVKAGGIDGD